MSTVLDPKIPPARSRKNGSATSSNRSSSIPANKRKYEILVVGSGLAGASAAAA
jgi:succinate dehydrogenase / fumarate reductase flavoprotein subunit